MSKVKSLAALLCALLALTAVSCATYSSIGDRRLQAAVSAVMDRVDPQNAAVILADDAQIQHVQGLVGKHRRVVSVTIFAKEHPEDSVPSNILFESAVWRETRAVIKVHVQAVSHPPPQTLYCGTGYTFEVIWVDGNPMVRPIEETVC